MLFVGGYSWSLTGMCTNSSTKALSGVFRMTDTVGLPLEIILLECRDRGVAVAWDEFISDAKAHGWTDKTIRKKIMGAVSEAFGFAYLKEFTKRFESYYAAS